MQYEVWSIGHYLFMVLPFLLWGLFYFITKDKPYEYKRSLGIKVSILAVILLLLRNIEYLFVRNFSFDFEMVPLQICHFANFVLLYAFYKNDKTFFAFAWLFNLPAAFLSIVFSNGLENYDTILNFRGLAYILGHALIVALTLYAYSGHFIELNKKVLIKLIKLLIPLYLGAHIINIAFFTLFNQPSNYFYTMRPEAGTPLELFHDMGTNYTLLGAPFNPLYLVLTGLFGGVVILSIFLVTVKLEMVPKKKAS
ncbi:MAG: hypothetical protein ACLFRI_06340 [Candidatus Izemoplasmataceae bacterium]